MSEDVKVVIGFVVTVIIACRVYSNFAVKEYKKKRARDKEQFRRMD